jgi:hypothetical protein
MAVIDMLKQTVVGAGRVARSASQQVQGTAAPLLKQAARQVRSQLEQRRGATPAAPSAPPTRKEAPSAEPEAPPTPAGPTPATVAKNIPPKPAPNPAPKKQPAKKSVPGAKLPVKRPANGPDPA